MAPYYLMKYMESKKHYIQNLPNKKIVIGNGFDLHCGLKTRYCDFFDDFWKDKTFEKKEIDSRLDKPNFNNFDNLSNLNAWDIYFYLYTNPKEQKEEIKWCDVESTIFASLSNDVKSDFPKWKNIFNYDHTDNDIEKFIKNNLANRITYEKKALLFLSEYVNGKTKDETNKYKWLLDELKKFELNFRKYIQKQVDNDKENYNVNIYEFFNIFDSKNNTITSIDSFNYSDLPAPYHDILHHINGDTTTPIFGIDSRNNEENNIFFSKTSRRVELDMIKEEYETFSPFENIIIYGHSLCEADYSYFFSIFDKVKIFDTTENSKIVFAYSIPGEAKDRAKNEIITKTIYNKNINNLFNEYAKYKGYVNQPNRMLDFLTTQRRIILFEI